MNRREAERPSRRPARSEVFINLKTAKTMGLTLPQPRLARADELIE